MSKAVYKTLFLYLPMIAPLPAPLCSDFVLAELPSPLKYPRRWPVGSRWVRSPQHGVSTGCCALRAVPRDLQNSYAGWEMQNVSLLFLQALMLLRAKRRLQISVCVVERHSEVYCLKEATWRRTQTSSSVWLRGAVSSRQGHGVLRGSV